MASSTIISSNPSPPLTSLSCSLPLPFPLLELFLGLLGPLAPLTLCLIEHPTPRSEHHTQALRSTSIQVNDPTEACVASLGAVAARILGAPRVSPCRVVHTIDVLRVAIGNESITFRTKLI